MNLINGEAITLLH